MGWEPQTHSGTRAAWWVALALLVAALVAVVVWSSDARATFGDGGGTPAPAAAPPLRPDRVSPLPLVAGRKRPVVVLYGDSLAWEARQSFSFTLAAAGADVKVRTFGGTAICDFFT